MLIITNRTVNDDNINDNIGNENAFGDELNEKNGQQILSIAIAKKENSDWNVELIQRPNETEDVPNVKIPSFENQYFELRKKLVEDDKNCVFFVHGFNQSFEKNLEKCLDIERIHGVEVIAFSWPSNLMNTNLIREYRLVKSSNAVRSAEALNSIFNEFDKYHKKIVNKRMTVPLNSMFSFLVFSLGNFLFQKSIDQDNPESHPMLFDNVILCQADVRREGHKEWGDKINVGKRIYTTINQNDGVLKSASTCERFFRLGETAKKLNCDDMVYVDFTDGKLIEHDHELFRHIKNKHARNFFTNVLNGNEVHHEKKFNFVFEFVEKSKCYKFRPGFRKSYSK